MLRKREEVVLNQNDICGAYCGIGRNRNCGPWTRSRAVSAPSAPASSG